MKCWIQRDRSWSRRIMCGAATALLLCLGSGIAAEPLRGSALLQYRLGTLRRAVDDIAQTYGEAYPRAHEFRSRLQILEQQLKDGSADGDRAALHRAVSALQQEALLSNPVLDSTQVLLVKRRPLSRRGITPGLDIALPSNHECNSSLSRGGHTNEICILPGLHPAASLRTVYKPKHAGYVGELDLNPGGGHFLFTQSDATNWKVLELSVDGSGLRQVSTMPDDVDSFDACYLPNGKIVFGSTASVQAVPCWHGLKKVSNLYVMNADGTGTRQLCFDQDHNLHPVVLPNGQVLYHRWDYTGINHIFLRELMVMNPDGTVQRAIYGSGSWYPNALYFPRPLPEEPGRIICILSGYHGVHRMGQLVILDTKKGWHEAKGIVQRISGVGSPVNPVIKDNLVDDDWPKFLHPFPINDKYFLVSALLNSNGQWGIYLADVFDNLVLVREEPGWALLEPVPLRPHRLPPIIPEQVDLSQKEGLVYLHDVYAGPGLEGVPRGTVKRLRLLSYHFGYPGLAGPDRIGYGGPWEVMRVLGTVPVESDGSAFFRVPANTPIAVQPLDAEGKAVQLMRSWFTVMPGEKASCIGCHERPNDTPPVHMALAANRPPLELTPWHGPARGFDFEREVQPVLDRYCVDCHDGTPLESHSSTRVMPDLRSIGAASNYIGRPISAMGLSRLHPAMRADTGGVLQYSPAYDSLISYIRRVGIEDDVSMLTPGEYHADTSPLIQMLNEGHHGVVLDPESWERLFTWIDLNAPCHGTWGEVYPIPDQVHERRMELRRQFGGPAEDPEFVPQTLALTASAKPPLPASQKKPPLEVSLVAHGDPAGRRTITIAPGLSLKLVQIPAGEFTSRGTSISTFWMSACEISNEQFRQFAPGHNSGYYQKRNPALEPGVPDYIGPGSRGLDLNGDAQPVVRVCWDQAMAFCRWLSDRTGLHFTLPTESQWEWACRAGSRTPWNFGGPETDFSPWANLADRSFSKGLGRDGKQITGGLEHLVLEGGLLSDIRFHDGSVVTAPVGSFQQNSWGLHDMHGNAAEWTRTSLRDRKVVRGGSFFDPPARANSSHRIAYAPWQRVFNVGFRVILEEKGPASAE